MNIIIMNGRKQAVDSCFMLKKLHNVQKIQHALSGKTMFSVVCREREKNRKFLKLY